MTDITVIRAATPTMTPRMEITEMSDTKVFFLRERRWRMATIHSKDPKYHPFQESVEQSIQTPSSVSDFSDSLL